MILGKDSIQKEIDSGRLVIQPEYIIKAASVKAHLSGIFGEDESVLSKLTSDELKELL